MADKADILSMYEAEIRKNHDNDFGVDKEESLFSQFSKKKNTSSSSSSSQIPTLTNVPNDGVVMINPNIFQNMNPDVEKEGVVRKMKVVEEVAKKSGSEDEDEDDIEEDSEEGSEEDDEEEGSENDTEEKKQSRSRSRVPPRPSSKKKSAKVLYAEEMNKLHPDKSLKYWMQNFDSVDEETSKVYKIKSDVFNGQIDEALRKYAIECPIGEKRHQDRLLRNRENARKKREGETSTKAAPGKKAPLTMVAAKQGPARTTDVATSIEPNPELKELWTKFDTEAKMIGQAVLTVLFVGCKLIAQQVVDKQKTEQKVVHEALYKESELHTHVEKQVPKVNKKEALAEFEKPVAKPTTETTQSVKSYLEEVVKKTPKKGEKRGHEKQKSRKKEKESEKKRRKKKHKSSSSESSSSSSASSSSDDEDDVVVL